MDRKKVFKRIFVITIAVAMVFAMSATAFAANINYTVAFTYGGSNNGMYYPWGPATTMSISDTTPLTDKTYFTDEVSSTDYSGNTNINPLGTTTSVIDAVIAGINAKQKTFTTGLDLNPMYGNPGAYIKNVQGFTSWNQYEEYEQNGQWYGRSYGEGWQCYITPAGGTEAGATSYLSSIALNNGDYLRFDFRFYDYTWQIPGPSK